MFPTLATFVAVLLAVFVALAALRQQADRRAARRRFAGREPIAPRVQLEGTGIEGAALEQAVRDWEALARAYGYPADLLRADDRIDELVSVDSFGDRAVAFEARLKANGVRSLPAEATLADLVRLLGARR